jgi:hypothetical protein
LIDGTSFDPMPAWPRQRPATHPRSARSPGWRCRRRSMWMPTAISTSRTSSAARRSSRPAERGQGQAAPGPEVAPVGEVDRRATHSQGLSLHRPCARPLASTYDGDSRAETGRPPPLSRTTRATQSPLRTASVRLGRSVLVAATYSVLAITLLISSGLKARSVVVRRLPWEERMSSAAASVSSSGASRMATRS